MQRYTITENFNLTDSENANLLVVNATINVELENGCYDWQVASINLVELQFGYGCRSLDITQQIKSNPALDAIVTSQVAGQDDVIMDYFQDQVKKRKYAY
jgi:altronate dehydratase